MSKSNVAKRGRAGEQPVKSGIHRAARRIGLEPADAPLAPIPPGSIAELDSLRALAGAAARIFDDHGEIGNSPTTLLREALRAAASDLEVLSDASRLGGSVSSMAFLRASNRAHLAIAIAEYRQEFPAASDLGAP